MLINVLIFISMIKIVGILLFSMISATPESLKAGKVYFSHFSLRAVEIACSAKLSTKKVYILGADEVKNKISKCSGHLYHINP